MVVVGKAAGGRELLGDGRRCQWCARSWPLVGSRAYVAGIGSADATPSAAAARPGAPPRPWPDGACVLMPQIIQATPVLRTICGTYSVALGSRLGRRQPSSSCSAVKRGRARGRRPGGDIGIQPGGSTRQRAACKQPQRPLAPPQRRTMEAPWNPPMARAFPVCHPTTQPTRHLQKLNGKQPSRPQKQTRPPCRRGTRW